MTHNLFEVSPLQARRNRLPRRRAPQAHHHRRRHPRAHHHRRHHPQFTAGSAGERGDSEQSLSSCNICSRTRRGDEAGGDVRGLSDGPSGGDPTWKAYGPAWGGASASPPVVGGGPSAPGIEGPRKPKQAHGSSVSADQSGARTRQPRSRTPTRPELHHDTLPLSGESADCGRRRQIVAGPERLGDKTRTTNAGAAVARAIPPLSDREEV